MSKSKALKMKVFGRVQRVGYRRHVPEEARKLRLAGHVTNEYDDSVTIFVQGSGDSLDRFVDIIRTPDPPAKVDRVVWRKTRPNPKVKVFKIRYGEFGDELQEGFGAMQSEFKDYRAEFKDYRAEFRDFAKRTDKNFRLMSSRYGEISEKLTVILETLTRESRETRERLTEAMALLKQAIERISK